MRGFLYLGQFRKNISLKKCRINFCCCIFCNKTIRNVGNLAFFTFEFTLTDLENFGKCMLVSRGRAFEISVAVRQRRNAQNNMYSIRMCYIKARERTCENLHSFCSHFWYESFTPFRKFFNWRSIFLSFPLKLFFSDVVWVNRLNLLCVFYTYWTFQWRYHLRKVLHCHLPLREEAPETK